MSIKNILLISYCFPPVASPESFVTSKIMGGMEGVAVDVISADHNLFNGSADYSLNDYVKDKFRHVERIQANVLGKMVLSLPRLPLRPDRFVLLNRSACKVARAQIARYEYDAIVTRSQYHSSHLVGLKVKAENPGLPWIASFSDPWTANAYEFGLPIMSAWSARMASKVVRRADRLIFPTQGIRNFFQGQHPDVDITAKSAVISHGFDPSLYGDGEVQVQGGGPVKMRYFGNFYGPRRVDPLFKALAHLCVQERISAQNLNVEFFTQSASSVEGALEKYPLLKGIVKIYPPLDHLRALAEMKKADVLLLIEAEGPTPSIFLPSKLIDYIGANRPILALTVEGIALEYAKKVGAWHAHVGKEQEIANVVEQVIGASHHAGADVKKEEEIKDRSEFREQLKIGILAKKFREEIEKGIGQCRDTA